MSALVMTAQLILALTILVFVHELGHFLMAKLFRMRVDKFFIFFDAWKIRLFSKKIKETIYGIGWIPLGGYVKIAGMIDESMDKEAMKQPPQPWEYRSKPAWQRLIVITAGIIFNVILGVLIFSFYLHSFKQVYLPVSEIKDGIYAYELGQQVGLETGDKIIEVDDKPIERYDDILSLKVFFGATLTVIRGDEVIKIKIPDDFYLQLTKGGKERFIGSDNYEFVVDSVVPGEYAESAGMKKGDKIMTAGEEDILVWGDLKTALKDYSGKTIDVVVERAGQIKRLFMEVSEQGTIGIAVSQYPYKLASYNFEKSIKYGVREAFNAIINNTIGFGKIFKGEIKAQDAIASPIGIATMYGGKWDWGRFWYITGLISMILAFVNILPIPALDGGHVMFLTFEIISGRKPSDKFMEIAQVAGMLLLLVLMAFAIGNDIWKYIIR